MARPPDGRHPVVAKVDARRDESWQLRLADRITAFAGSMAFVWIHVGLFVIWIALLGYALKTDPFPFGFLTLVVSLEAIFLATFVMIGQNRQAEFARLKADHDFAEEEQELHLNTQLTREIHELVKELHKRGS